MSHRASFRPSSEPASATRATRCLAATLVLAAATLTGCNASSGSPAGESFPSLLGTSHFNGEAVSTLGANYTFPPDSHHRARLHDLRGQTPNRSGHRSSL